MRVNRKKHKSHKTNCLLPFCSSCGFCDFVPFVAIPGSEPLPNLANASIVLGGALQCLNSLPY